MRSTAVFKAMALPVSLSLSLTGCGDTTAVDDSARMQEAVENDAANAQLGIQLSQARVNLPAVEGRPGAAYFDLVSNRDEPVTIASISVMGAGEAQMHETKTEDGVAMMAEAGTIVLGPREAVRFKPGGFHVMLFDIQPTLKVGDTTDITVTLENGDKFSTTAQVLGAGQGMAGQGMADQGTEGRSLDGSAGGMDHSGMDHADMEGMN